MSDRMDDAYDSPFPIQLTTAELHFLLSFLYHPDTVPGTDTASLFPRNPVEREALWLKGAHEAEMDGWYAPDIGEGKAWVDSRYLHLGACMVDSLTALLSTVQETGHARRGVTHFVASDSVVEMALNEGIYEFSILDSVSVMAGRLATSYGLPTQERHIASFELERPVIVAAKRHPNPALLQQHGLAQEEADWFADSLSNPQTQGTITALQMDGGKAADMRLVGVLVGQNGRSWLGTPASNEKVRYELADRSHLETILASIIQRFSQPLVPTNAT